MKNTILPNVAVAPASKPVGGKPKKPKVKEVPMS